jgi:hypothetical protein
MPLWLGLEAHVQDVIGVALDVLRERVAVGSLV